MTWVAVGFAAFQVVNGAMQAETVRDQGKLSKEIADMNAEFAEIDSWKAEQDGETAVARYEGQVEKVLSDQRTVYAANDVDVNFGTAAEVVADTKLAGFLNVLDIKNQAHNKALGYKNQARQFISNGRTAQAQSQINASGVQNSALLNAGGTLVSGYTKGKAGKLRTTETNSWSSVGESYYDNSDKA